ncbi:hypothetical protein [Marisediminicola senii]|uniref:hypothetical protein n=1 Tax=Marisediminicola senii TaxID=2711233 RepID=UPI0013EA1466|nr:hypothetical protein [Marisediminicola senii]
MQEIPGRTVRDLPTPPTRAEVIARFGAPVFTLVPQPHLRELDGASTMAVNDTLQEVSLSYSYLRWPDDPADPRNLVPDIDEITHWIDKAHRDDQPEWFIASLESRRYPTVWEAVRSIHPDVGVAQTLAEHLAHHVNHVLINSVEGRRVDAAGRPPRLDAEVKPTHAQPAVLTVDGVELPAITIDTDPHIVGWAAQVGEVYVTVALDRERLLTLRVALTALP